MKSVFEDLRDLFGQANNLQGTAIVQLVTVTCCNCGTPFGVEANLHSKLQTNGKTFYCPNGHPQWYGESEADKLKKQLAQEAKKRETLETRLRDARAQAETAERRRAAAKGQLTKERNRIANGVCPCCNRFFEELHKHMLTQHPEYHKQEDN